MNNLTFQVAGNSDLRKSFKYLWMKNVSSFDNTKHCAKCLVGDYSKQFGLNMINEQAYTATVKDSEPLYFCGVSKPYKHDNNFHLAVIYAEGKRVVKTMYDGTTLIIEDAEEIKFDDESAIKNHSEKGKVFLTCRNFQFGSHYFE